MYDYHQNGIIRALFIVVTILVKSHLLVTHVFRRFLGQFAINFLAILQALFASPLPVTLQIFASILKVRPFDMYKAIQSLKRTLILTT